MTTLLEMKERVKSDLEMREEQYLPDLEITRLLNDSVAEAHRHIVKLYEDYFLAYSSQPLAADQSTLVMPADLFANKIRAIVYRDGGIGSSSVTCEFRKVKSLYDAVGMNNVLANTNGYMRLWLLLDQSVSARTIKLLPDNGMAGSVDIWYIRKPALMVNDSDICPIPEFADYVIQKAKVAYYRNDGDARYQVEKAELLELQEDLYNTLSNRTIGEYDNVIKSDTSFYEDSL